MKKIDIIGLALMVAGVALSFFTLWALILVVIGIITCSFYIVPQGYYGYVMVLEKNMGVARSNGWGLKVPFVSTITYVSAEPFTHTEHIQIQNAMNDNTGINYTLTFKFKVDYAHQLKQRVHSLSQKEYAERFLCKPIGQALGDICATKTNDELNTQRSQIAADALNLLAPDTYIEIISLSIGENFKYSEATEKANEQLAAIAREKKIVDANDEIIKKKAEQLLVTTEAKVAAQIKEAEGEAEAIRLRGEAEAEAIRKRGEMLAQHPELIEETKAQNRPKVVGGTPIVNVDNL